jgi:hypothetical protein
LSYYYILYNESKHDNIQTKQLFACLAIIVVVLGGPPPSPLKKGKQVTLAGCQRKRSNEKITRNVFKEKLSN